MEETAVLSATPETSVSNPPETTQPELVPATDHESTTESVPLAPNTITERVRGVAGKVLDQFNIPRSKGGRPRKDGLPNRQGVLPGGGLVPGAIAETPSAPPLVVPAVNDPVVASLFQRSLAGAVKEVFGFLKGVIRIGADAADVEREFTEKTLEACEPKKEAVEDLAESVRLVARKHGVTTENAEEWSLAINGARLLAPYALLWKTFDAEIKRKRSQEKNRKGGAN